MSEAAHWDEIYRSGADDRLGWFEVVPSTLPDVLESVPGRDARVVDVGAGASRLVDELLDRGHTDVLLVDVSIEGLDHTRTRLRDAGLPAPDLLVADVRTLDLQESVDVWHDRAVFHFLTTDDDRRAYVEAAHQSLAPGGALVVATFAPDGPESCAGLPVRRYDAEGLVSWFHDRFESVGCRRACGLDPGSDRRPYTVCRFRKRPDPAR